MKKYIYYLILVILTSCNSQEARTKNFTGNWYPKYSEDSVTEYFEMYVEEEKIYYYRPGQGLSLNNYKIENNDYYLVDKITGDLKKRGKISISNDTATIKMKDVDFELVLFKLKDKNRIGDIIKGKIDEDTFKDSFEARLLKW